MGAAKHGNPLALLALLLGVLMVLDGGAHAWRDGSSEGPQLGRHLLADVAIGYCGGAPFSLLNTTGKGTCAFPGVFGGCDGGGCWCSKNLDPSYNPCDALPQGSGPWTWCSAESQAVGECAQAGSCNLWFKQDPLGVVNFFAKAGCAAEDAISASANNNFKFGLVVAHGGGGGCGYSQLRPGSEGLYSFVVGRNKNQELQGLSNLNVCYTMTPSSCQCTGGTDPNNWSQGAPAYLCPGSPFKYTGGGALLRDSCGNDVDVRYFILQRKVGTSDWANVADIPYPSVALENPELYTACGTYRLAATVCGTTFYRTILVREIDVNTYNDPIIPQGGKTYCPGAAVNAADLFTSLTAKVLGSGEPGIACSFAPTVAAATYPDSCTSGGSITATFSVCPATTSPVASAGSGETRQVTVTTYEPLVPSPGWAAVTEAAPFGFVGFQCPDPHATLGTLTLSSSCPGRPDTVPVITPGGQVDADGCGTLTGTATQCGQTFGRKVVQDVESLNKPVVGPPDTQCPGYLTPNAFLPLTTTANMVGAPPDAPKCTAQGAPVAFPPAPDSCGSTSYTRTYSLCGKQVTSDPRVLITDALMSDGGWSANTDYLCPYERLNLTPVTLTSNCPSWTIPGNPFVPVMDGPGFPWNGCGAVRFKVSFCGETFTKNYVRGAAVTTAPSLHTICPNAPPPNPLFIPGYTSVTVPGSNPPKPCFLLPTPVRPAPMPQATCGTTTYSRKYLFCGTAVREDAVVTVNEVFGGFDPACPFKYITSCPTPNCVKLATLVGQPEVAGGCVFTETVKATVCGVDHVEKYTFSSCQVADA